MFKGEILRGLLLNAYAFGTMGAIAGIAAVVAFIGSALMPISPPSARSTAAVTPRT